MIRNKILNFLQWNDRNGSYTDSECELEGLEPLTLKQSIQMFTYTIGELDDWYEINITEEFKKNPIIKKALQMLLTNDDTIKTYRKVVKIL